MELLSSVACAEGTVILLSELRYLAISRALLVFVLYKSMSAEMGWYVSKVCAIVTYALFFLR